MSLPGPSRTIIVEPIEQPAKTPVPSEPAPEREPGPAEPAPPAPEKQPERVPA